MTREQLTEQLEWLDAALPGLILRHPGLGDFWNAFSARIQFAAEAASADDYEWVNERIDDLLRKHDVLSAAPEEPNEEGTRPVVSVGK